MMESMGLPRNTPSSGYQAHHVIPVQAKEHPVIQTIGMDLDDASNGIFLPVPDEGIHSLSTHTGRHTVYNEVVERELNRIDLNLPVEELDKEVLVHPV